MSDITITTRGALFEASAFAIADRHVSEAMDDIGKATQEQVTQRLDDVLVNPTGHYRSQVQHSNRLDNVAEVHDSGVVYGPWLEGVGSRNATSRFKGYSTFRKTRDEMEGKAARLANPAMRQMAKELES